MTRADLANAARMQAWRADSRRRLDALLTGLDGLPERPPGLGWVQVIREALGMTRADLGARLGVTGQRVNQFEKAEVAGTIPLSTMARLAAGLSCRFSYVVVPNEALESMVWRQALRRATEESGRAETDDLQLHQAARIEARALDLVDRRGLWRWAPPAARPETP